MSKFKVSECASDRHWHLFAVDDNEGNSVAHFTVATYGLALAREKAEAECKFLNEKNEKFVVKHIPCECFAEYRVVHKVTGHATAKFYGDYMTDDLARTEAARLCQMLNERDAKGVQS